MSKPMSERDIVPDNSPVLYFVDGFHGGIKGHMAPGSVADILHGLEKFPDWRVMLEVEPISFEHLRRTEPDTFFRLKELVEADYDSARVEIVSGGYAQPFFWAMSGESAVRQLVYGKRTVAESFPGAAVDTYSVQEPCFTAALPQLLNQLGFRRAVLKNSTCWGGYTASHDAEICLWEGPDGSRIAAVPRYGCEDLIFCWAIEGSGYDKTALDSYAAKCLENGIRHPVGMTLQDLGWKGEPWINEKYQKFVTWRQYFSDIADKPTDIWKFSQEDILVTIPWGEKTLQKMSNRVRAAENAVLPAEKLALTAKILAKAEYPAAKLREAWNMLMLAQHHDAWICASAGSWYSKAEHQTNTVRDICDETVGDALFALNRDEALASGDLYIRVFNTAGFARTSVAEAVLSLPHGTRSVTLTDESGRNIPVQMQPFRRFNDDKSVNSCRLCFPAEVPAAGFASFLVTPNFDTSSEAAEGAVSVSQDESSVYAETDRYRIRLDLTRGGTFASLFDKTLDREIVPCDGDALFNEYRGYFIEDEKFFSTRDVAVSAKIRESGPVRAVIELDGSLNNQFFRITLTLSQGDPLIRVKTFFHFRGVYIGHPWEMPPERNNLEPKKSNHDDTYKLRALFPTSFGSGRVFKNSAFDVCESKLDNTVFMGWNKIKHNIIVNWVDTYDEGSDMGLALFSSNTTSYQHGADMPLGLTLAWGWQGGFWWGKSRLEGGQECSYALMPHSGKWDGAGISAADTDYCEPFITSVLVTDKLRRPSASLLRMPRGFALSAFYEENGSILLRVFAAEAKGDCSVSLGFDYASAEAVNPDGTPADFIIDADGSTLTIRNMPRFGIRTLRITL